MVGLQVGGKETETGHPWLKDKTPQDIFFDLAGSLPPALCLWRPDGGFETFLLLGGLLVHVLLARLRPNWVWEMGLGAGRAARGRCGWSRLQSP